MLVKSLKLVSDGVMEIGQQALSIDTGSYYYIDDAYIWFGTCTNWKNEPCKIELIDDQGKSIGVFYKHQIPAMTSFETPIPVDCAVIWTK